MRANHERRMVMGGGESCQRIVESRPGQQTGETVYVTEDGTRWTSETPSGPIYLTGTGNQVIGYVHGNRICQHR